MSETPATVRQDIQVKMEAIRGHLKDLTDVLELTVKTLDEVFSIAFDLHFDAIPARSLSAPDEPAPKKKKAAPRKKKVSFEEAEECIQLV
jgi:hypothetical protein